jgi:hypothetical protein
MMQLLRLVADRTFDMPRGFLRAFDMGCAILFATLFAWTRNPVWMAWAGLSTVLAITGGTWLLQQSLRRGLRLLAVLILLWANV